LLVKIHQPEFLPWLGYFNKIRLCDLLVIEDDVQYRRQRFQNRNLIKTPTGPRWLAVPVEHEDVRKKICEVRIMNKIEHGNFWYERHLRTLQANYGRARFYRKYITVFEEVYDQQWETLADCNIAFLQALFKILGINIPIQKSSELQLETSKNERIIDICKREGAEAYVSGTGGLNYLNEGLFKMNGIDVLIHDYVHPVYSQRFMKLGFLTNMSVIDLIMDRNPWT